MHENTPAGSGGDHASARPRRGVSRGHDTIRPWTLPVRVRASASRSNISSGKRGSSGSIFGSGAGGFVRTPIFRRRRADPRVGRLALERMVQLLASFRAVLPDVNFELTHGNLASGSSRDRLPNYYEFGPARSSTYRGENSRKFSFRKPISENNLQRQIDQPAPAARSESGGLVCDQRRAPISGRSGAGIRAIRYGLRSNRPCELYQLATSLLGIEARRSSRPFPTV